MLGIKIKVGYLGINVLFEIPVFKPLDNPSINLIKGKFLNMEQSAGNEGVGIIDCTSTRKNCKTPYDGSR